MKTCSLHETPTYYGFPQREKWFDMNVTVTPLLSIYKKKKKKKKTFVFQDGWKGVWCFLATRYPNSDVMTGEAGSGEEGQGRQSTWEEGANIPAISIVNYLSSDLLSPRVMLGFTSSMVKYPNFRACQLPSALIPQDSLNRRETLHSFEHLQSHP